MEMKWVSSDEFEKRMDENPNAVYVVETFLDNGNRSDTGIFSTKRKAEDWCYEPIRWGQRKMNNNPICKSNDEWIPAYEGQDILRYITETGFKLYMSNPAETIKSMVNGYILYKSAYRS